MNKPGPLTPAEYEVMKTHCALGAQIMEDALLRHKEELLQVAYNICRWHHERYDGGGYPDGLRGEEIQAQTAQNGWCAVLVDGVPVGFGKKSGEKIKNHYPKALRNLK